MRDTGGLGHPVGRDRDRQPPSSKASGISTRPLALLNPVMLGAAFLGALVFGRLADAIGRTRVYWMSAALMVIAAVGSALAPSLLVLTAFRFLLDYAYYGNTISTPPIISLIAPHASQTTTSAIQLAIFAVAAVPGYILAILKMDRLGHRRLQLIGFVMMDLCFAVIGLVPGMTTAVAPFLAAYGISYFFTEFGPNVTTFVLPGELFPASVRATGHGISAGIGKLGAFIGVFLFPLLQGSLGLRGTLLLTAGISVLGAMLTLILPEPAGRGLEELSGDAELIAQPGR